MIQEHRPPAPLVDRLRRSSQVLICTHMEPDGDCIGSSLALASALRRSGKEVHQFNPGPFDRSEIREYRDAFLPHVPEHLQQNKTGRLVVILDCSLPERIDTLAKEIEGLPTIVADHHPVDNPMGDEAWVVPEAPAAAILVQILIESLDLIPTSEEARLLMFAFSTDTGFFRHTSETHAPAFSALSRLLSYGASPRDAHAQMFGHKTFESRKLIATLLERMQGYFDGRFLITWERQEDTRRVGKENRDSDTFYQLAFAIESCEALVLIREEAPGRCTGSLRSRKDIDVSTVARKFGGGGHKNASGFLAEVDCMELVERMVEAFEPLFGASNHA